MRADIVEQAADAVYALHMTCADDGEQHLVRDDLATAGVVFGVRVTALCGHKVAVGSLVTLPSDTCDICPRAAEVLGFATP